VKRTDEINLMKLGYNANVLNGNKKNEQCFIKNMNGKMD
jgi:hypothetical protein